MDLKAMEELAGRLRRAYETQDFDALGALLAPDVRWGGEEETPQTCHTRGEVLAWFRGLRDRGVRAAISGAEVRADAIVLSLEVTRPGEEPFHRGQIFLVTSGRIVDIRDARLVEG
jgi:hypothetical protein